MSLRLPLLLLLIFFLLPTLQQSTLAAQESVVPAATIAPLPDAETLQQWIAEIKRNRRGPFKRLRWFCNDGTILPPAPYACREHGGGVQHGQWSDRVLLLRQHNYLIATLLADLWPATFYVQSEWPSQLKQIILEQYLIEVDDGWLFRRARYYRGALQAEDENWHGEALLLGLLEQPGLLNEQFLLLREAARHLPHGRQQGPLLEMRQLALEIEETDPGFAPLRIKLHTRPDATDSAQVRRHAELVPEERQEKYQRLAELVDAVTSPHDNPLRQAYQLGIDSEPPLVADTDQPEAEDWPQLSANIRFSRASQLLLRSRTELTRAAGNQAKLNWLDSSLDLEDELYRSANQLLNQLPTASRRQRLAWIEQGLNALYGIGFLSERQLADQQKLIETLLTEPLSAPDYQRELMQLS
ncbi:MAG TPA: hypothetical protein VIR78_05120, partial [Malonomonas sp.]